MKYVVLLLMLLSGCATYDSRNDNPIPDSRLNWATNHRATPVVIRR